LDPTSQIVEIKPLNKSRRRITDNLFVPDLYDLAKHNTLTKQNPAYKPLKS